MNLKDEFKYRVDAERFDDAIETADYLANNFIKTGRFVAKETWGPEGLFYLAESSWALMDAYLFIQKPLYIEAVESILKALKQLQKNSGGWSLEIGKNGICFKISDDERNEICKREDLPPTAAILRTINEYENITGDITYHEMGNMAFSFLLKHWDSTLGTFIENKDDKVMNLRSNPKSYSIFFFWGVNAWNNNSYEIKEKEMIRKLLATMKDTFESYDNQSMPLTYGLHAAVLMDYCTMDYIKSIIKDKIDNDLVYNKTFKCVDSLGGYGHRDGLRGIVTNEAHMRSVAGIAIAMKKYDLVTNSRTYRDSEQYANISNWIQSMRGKGFYYEFELLNEKKKLGYGSPGQYLPIWWILGKI